MVSTSVPSYHDYLSDPTLGLVRGARPAQLQMATAIDQMLESGGSYYVEAPVATGKTFAYLLPALLRAGRRVVVSTDKTALQDQILNKDFPAIRNVASAALTLTRALPLKGKGHYACRLAAKPRLEANPQHAGVYATFLARSTYGDKAEYPGVLPPWYPYATAEDCIHRRCEHFNGCGYAQLRGDLVQARLIVINHHLLGAEMVFGHGKLVGGPFDVLIVDEAHSLATGVRAAFTHKVTEDAMTSLEELLRRGGQDTHSIRKMVEPWKEMFAGVQADVDDEERSWPVFPDDIASDMHDSLLQVAKDLVATTERYNAPPETPLPRMTDAFDEEIDAIEIDPNTVAAAAEDTKGLVLAVVAQAQRRVDSLLKGVARAQGMVEPSLDVTDPDKQEMRRLNIMNNTAIYSTKDERSRFAINCAPVNVGGYMNTYLSNVKTMVMCSGTLTIDGSFDRISHETGIKPTKTEVLPTSFNYPAQGMVFVPRDLPGDRGNEKYKEYMAKRVAMAGHLIKVAKGGALILTTANDELDMYAEALKPMFPGRVFAQGQRWDGDANVALTKFRAAQNAVLIGSLSYWQGLDIPGPAVRLVIISKLPFTNQKDAIVQARRRIVGPERSFLDVTIADMLVLLRQGAGRLIRTRQDLGVLAILDSNIWDKAHGALVRRALPWYPHGQISSDLKAYEWYMPQVLARFGI